MGKPAVLEVHAAAHHGEAAIASASPGGGNRHGIHVGLEIGVSGEARIDGHEIGRETKGDPAQPVRLLHCPRPIGGHGSEQNLGVEWRDARARSAGQPSHQLELAQEILVVGERATVGAERHRDTGRQEAGDGCSTVAEPETAAGVVRDDHARLGGDRDVLRKQVHGVRQDGVGP